MAQRSLVDQVDLRHLYRSSAYKNQRKAYVQTRAPRRTARGDSSLGVNPALAHLQESLPPVSLRRSVDDVEKIKEMKEKGKNYLAEQRQQRLARDKTRSAASRVKTVIKDPRMSALDKLKFVREQVDQIEAAAMNRERIPVKQSSTGPSDQKNHNSRTDKIQNDFDKVDEVNKMMLDAIKAKLAVIDHNTSMVGGGDQGGASLM